MEPGFQRVLYPAGGKTPVCQISKDFDQDFQNELQSFNDAVTQLSSEAKAVYMPNNEQCVDDSFCDQSSSDSSSYDLSKSMSDNNDEENMENVKH